MAANRMFLLHRPTGLAFGIAKRNELVWYCGGDYGLNAFFSRVEESMGPGDDPDDFVVVREDEIANECWRVTETGIAKSTIRLENVSDATTPPCSGNIGLLARLLHTA